MSYRNDLDALEARHAALEHEVRERTRELDQARRLLEDAKAIASLPVLDNIRVASPCSMPWTDMIGDGRTRACATCMQNVYNLSNLTRAEAESLIIEKAGNLCVRYYQRFDGTILLKDCAVGLRRRRRVRLISAGVTAGLAAAPIAYLSHNVEPLRPPAVIDLAKDPQPNPERNTRLPLPTPREEVQLIQGALPMGPYDRTEDEDDRRHRRHYKAGCQPRGQIDPFDDRPPCRDSDGERARAKRSRF
jgi:hypothetical protein